MEHTLKSHILRNALICLSTTGLLAACGGGDAQVTNSDESTLLANGEACSAAWVSTTAYVGGNKVSYAGVNYTANWWTQGNNPSTSNGPAGSGQPWTKGYTCGATTTSTKTTTTTTKAGVTTSTTTTTKGTTTTTTVASGLNPNLPPGGNFNLAPWQLQLPTGSSGNIDTASGASLEGGFTKKPYFYTDSGDGSMVMMDPNVGWTTSGSLHPRTEMRENATWFSSGTNILDATLRVTKVNGSATVAQIFQGTGPSKPVCELEFSTDSVHLFLENTNEGGGGVTTPITTIPLGDKFTYQIKLSGSTITVKVNGVTKTFTMDSSFSGEKFYFKAGNYDQAATSGTPQTNDGTVVKFYGLKITH